MVLLRITRDTGARTREDSARPDSVSLPAAHLGTESPSTATFFPGLCNPFPGGIQGQNWEATDTETLERPQMSPCSLLWGLGLGLPPEPRFISGVWAMFLRVTYLLEYL